MDGGGEIISIIITKYAKHFIKCEFGLDIFSDFQCHCPIFQNLTLILVVSSELISLINYPSVNKCDLERCLRHSRIFPQHFMPHDARQKEAAKPAAVDQALFW